VAAAFVVELALTVLTLTAFIDDDGSLEAEAAAAAAAAAATTAASSRPVDVAGRTVCPVTPPTDDATTPLP